MCSWNYRYVPKYLHDQKVVIFSNHNSVDIHDSAVKDSGVVHQPEESSTLETVNVPNESLAENMHTCDPSEKDVSTTQSWFICIQ